MAKRSEGDYVALSRDFATWLEEEGKVKNDASIAIFAARMTDSAAIPKRASAMRLAEIRITWTEPDSIYAIDAVARPMPTGPSTSVNSVDER